MIVYEENPYYHTILHYGARLFAAASTPFGVSPGPAVNRMYAFFLTVCTDMLGLDLDIALRCSLKLSNNDDIANEIVRHLARYRAHWDDARIHFSDSTSSLAQPEDLPVLFDYVMRDLADIGVTISFSALASETSSFLKDLSSALQPRTIPAACLEPHHSFFASALPVLVIILILSILFLIFSILY